MGYIRLPNGQKYEYEGDQPSQQDLNDAAALSEKLNQQNSGQTAGATSAPFQGSQGGDRKPSPEKPADVRWKETQTAAANSLRDFAGQFWRSIGEGVSFVVGGGYRLLNEGLLKLKVPEGTDIEVQPGVSLRVRGSNEAAEFVDNTTNETFQLLDIPQAPPDTFAGKVGQNFGASLPFVGAMRLGVPASRMGANTLNRSLDYLNRIQRQQAGANTVRARVGEFARNQGRAGKQALGQMNKELVDRPLPTLFGELSSEVGATFGGELAAKADNTPLSRLLGEVTAGALTGSPAPYVGAAKGTSALGKQVGSGFRNFGNDVAQAWQAPQLSKKASQTLGAIGMRIPAVRAGAKALKARKNQVEREAGKELREILPEDSQEFIYRQADNGGEVIGEGDLAVDTLYQYLAAKISNGKMASNDSLYPFISRRLQESVDRAANDLRGAGVAKDFDAFVQNRIKGLEELVYASIQEAKDSAINVRGAFDEVGSNNQFPDLTPEEISSRLYNNLLEARRAADEQESRLFQEVGPAQVDLAPFLKRLRPYKTGKGRAGRAQSAEKSNYEKLFDSFPEPVQNVVRRQEAYEAARFGAGKVQRGEWDWNDVAAHIDKQVGPVVRKDGEQPRLATPQYAQKLASNRPDTAVPLEEFRLIQNRMGGITQDAKSVTADTQDRELASLAASLKKETKDTLEELATKPKYRSNTFTAQQQTLLKGAIDYSSRMHDAFDTDPTIQRIVTNPDRPEIEGADFLSTQVSPGPSESRFRRVRALQTANRAALDEQQWADDSDDIIQNFIRGRFYQLAVDHSDENLKVIPEKVSQFFREYDNLINTETGLFPALGAEFKNAENAIDIFRNALDKPQTLDEAVRNPEAPPGSGMLSIYADAPSRDIWKIVFNGDGTGERSLPLTRMRQLMANMREAKADPNVYDSLKYHFRVYLAEQAGFPLDVDKQFRPSAMPNTITAARAVDFLENPATQDVLQEVFTAKEIEDMLNSAKVLRDKARVTIADPRQVPKEIVDDPKDEIIDTLSRFAGATLGSRINQNVPGASGIGGNLVFAQEGSRRLRQFGERLTAGSKSKVLANAMKDPKEMTRLMDLDPSNPRSPSRPYNPSGPSTRLKLVKGYLFNEAGPDRSEENQKQVPVVNRRRLAEQWRNRTTR